MKRFFKSLIPAVAAAALMVACNPEPATVTPVGGEISVSRDTIQVPATGVPAVTVTVTTDGSWVATTSEWIHVDPSHAKGTVDVTVTIDDNEDAEGNLQGPRTGEVSIATAEASVKIVVLQDGDAALDTRRTYNKVTDGKINSGKAYLIVADDGAALQAGTPLAASKSYGYIYPTQVEDNNGTIELADASLGYIFTEVDGGFAIQQPDGRYLVMTTYNSYNLENDYKDGGVWAANQNADGTFEIKNVKTGQWMQYSLQYTSYGAYTTESGVMPYLYEDTKEAEIDNTKCFFSSASVKVGADATTATFDIVANVDWTLTKTEGDWVTEFTPASGSADATVTVTFTANETEEARTATFHLASNDGKKTADLTLTQASAAVTTLADVIAAGEGEFTSKNLLVMAIGSSNVIVRDATATMLAYGKSLAGAVKVGDIVTLSGSVKSYNGVIEWDNPTAEVASSGNAVDHGEAVVLDEAALVAYAGAPVVEYARAEGVRNDASYTTLVIGDQLLNIYGTMETETGKTYQVAGYTIGYDSKNTKTNFVVTSYEEVEVAPPFVWDYTPSTDYLNPNNLWKPVFDGDNDYAYGFISNWTVYEKAADVPGITKNMSTYVWTFENASEGEWGCCNFLAPNADNLIALKAGKKYNLKVTVGATANVAKFIFSLHDYKADADNREGDWKTDMWDALEANTPKELSTEFDCAADMNVAWTIIPQWGTPAGMKLYIKDICIIDLSDPEPEFAKFQWREDSVAEQTAAFNEPGAAHWYIDADKDVEWDAVVKLNGEVTTEMVTVEKFETGGGHIAINYAANESPAAKVWDITVTSTSYVENTTLTAKLTQGAYEYTDLAELNAAIIASGTAKVDRVVNLASGVEITKISGKNVFAQNATGGILLYGTGLESKGMDENGGNAIIGKFTVTTTSYKGLPEITAVVSQSEDAKIGVWSGQYPCFNRTVAEIEADYAKFVNAKCKISNVEVTKPFGATKTGEIKDASGSLAIYNYATDLTTDIPAGTKAEYVIVWPTVFTTHQLGFYKASQLNITSMPSTITMPATKALGVGDTFELGATTVQPDATITYASSNEAVATVSAEGLVTAVAAGEATITASVAAKDKYEAAEATCVVTVTTEAKATKEVSYDFTTADNYPEGFPTATGTAGDRVSATFGEASLVINAPNAYYMIASGSEKALFFGKSAASIADGAYLEFPAVAGYKLTKVVYTVGANAAANFNVNIFAADGTKMGTDTNVVKGAELTFEIDGAVNTPYRFGSLTSGKNFQVSGITLTYTEE